MKKLDKIFLLVTIALVLTMSVFLYSFDQNQKKQLTLIKLDKPIEVTLMQDRLIYNIDSINTKDNIFSINGWAYVKGINSIDVIPSIILKDDNNNLYKAKTRITKRRDITQEINDGKDYNNCGILAQFSTDASVKGKRYKVGIQVKIGKNMYFTWTDKQLEL